MHLIMHIFSFHAKLLNDSTSYIRVNSNLLTRFIAFAAQWSWRVLTRKSLKSSVDTLIKQGYQCRRFTPYIIQCFQIMHVPLSTAKNRKSTLKGIPHPFPYIYYLHFQHLLMASGSPMSVTQNLQGCWGYRASVPPGKITLGIALDVISHAKTQRVARVQGAPVSKNKAIGLVRP